jgi:hypothetical protein
VRDFACSLLEGPSRLKRWHKRLCSSQSCVSSNDQAAGSAVPRYLLLPPAEESISLLSSSPLIFSAGVGVAFATTLFDELALASMRSLGPRRKILN